MVDAIGMDLLDGHRCVIWNLQVGIVLHVRRMFKDVSQLISLFVSSPTSPTFTRLHAKADVLLTQSGLDRHVLLGTIKSRIAVCDR